MVLFHVVRNFENRLPSAFVVSDCSGHFVRLTAGYQLCFLLMSISSSVKLQISLSLPHCVQQNLN